MPIIKSAIKRVKQATKRRERNVSVKKDIKSAVKAFFAKPSQATLSAAQSEIDTAVKKKLINKNTAARRKASLAKVAKEAGVKPTASAKTKKAVPAKKPATKTAAAKKPAAKKTAVKKTETAKKTTAKKPAAKKTTK